MILILSKSKSKPARIPAFLIAHGMWNWVANLFVMSSRRGIKTLFNTASSKMGFIGPSPLPATWQGIRAVPVEGQKDPMDDKV